jgi:hypothetical protein
MEEVIRWRDHDAWLLQQVARYEREPRNSAHARDTFRELPRGSEGRARILAAAPKGRFLTHHLEEIDADAELNPTRTPEVRTRRLLCAEIAILREWKSMMESDKDIEPEMHAQIFAISQKHAIAEKDAMAKKDASAEGRTDGAGGCGGGEGGGGDRSGGGAAEGGGAAGGAGSSRGGGAARGGDTTENGGGATEGRGDEGGGAESGGDEGGGSEGRGEDDDLGYWTPPRASTSKGKGSDTANEQREGVRQRCGHCSAENSQHATACSMCGMCDLALCKEPSDSEGDPEGDTPSCGDTPSSGEHFQTPPGSGRKRNRQTKKGGSSPKNKKPRKENGESSSKKQNIDCALTYKPSDLSGKEDRLYNALKKWQTDYCVTNGMDITDRRDVAMNTITNRTIGSLVLAVRLALAGDIQVLSLENVWGIGPRIAKKLGDELWGVLHNWGREEQISRWAF